MKSHEASLFQPGRTDDAGGMTKPALSPSANRTRLVTALMGVKLAPNFTNEGPFHALQEPLAKSRTLAVNPRSFPATNQPLSPANVKVPTNCVPPAGSPIRALDFLDHWSTFERVPSR